MAQRSKCTKPDSRFRVVRALTAVTALLAATTLVAIAMQSDGHAEISGMPAFPGGITLLSSAALFVLSGSVYTRHGAEIGKSSHPVMFRILTALFVIAGVRVLLLI